jgi:hypothetical protein
MKKYERIRKKLFIDEMKSRAVLTRLIKIYCTPKELQILTPENRQ